MYILHESLQDLNVNLRLFKQKLTNALKKSN